MRCNNCGFESEDNFCKICGIEITEEQDNIEPIPEISVFNNSIEYSESAPKKKKKTVRKILLSVLAIIAGITLVSSASIYIFALTTKIDDKLYYHSINQKVSCGEFSIALTDVSSPKALAKKIHSDYYYDNDGYTYSPSEIENNTSSIDIDIDKLEHEITTNYETSINYPIELTFYNNSDTEKNIYINSLFPSTEYSENTFNNELYDFYNELVIIDSDGYIDDYPIINIPAWSKTTVNALLILSSIETNATNYNGLNFKKYDSKDDSVLSHMFGYNINSYFSSGIYSLYNSNVDGYNDISYAEIEDCSHITLPDECYIDININENGKYTEYHSKFFISLPPFNNISEKVTTPSTDKN